MNKEVTEKEKEILKKCLIPQRNKDLKESLIKNPSWLSKYLIHLQKIEYLKRDINTRKYQTTQLGANFLVESEVIADATASTVRMPLMVELPHGTSEPDYRMKIDYDVPVPPKVEKAAIEGFLYLDEGHKDKFAEIIKELRNESWGFETGIKVVFQEISRAVSRVYGYKDEIGPVWGVVPPYNFKNLDLKRRISLDFKAGIDFRFDGRSIVQKVPWDQLLKYDTEYDKKFERVWRRRKQAIIKQKDYRKMWLEHVVKDDIVLSKDIQAATKEEAEKKFIQEIRRKRNSFPMSRGVVGVRAHLPTEQDVQEVLDDFQSEGLLKIMPKIVATWVFEIVDKDKLEAKGDKIYKELEKISGINAS